MDPQSLAMRMLNALDPRPGDGWTPVQAARVAAIVALALAVSGAAYAGLPVPAVAVEALWGAALALLAHDAGVLKQTPG